MGSICAHKLLILALVLNLLSYASHSEGDVSVMSLRGLVKAISLFEGVKRRVFLAVNRIKSGLRLLIIRFFWEKYLKPHFGNVFWEGEF